MRLHLDLDVRRRRFRHAHLAPGQFTTLHNATEWQVLTLSALPRCVVFRLRDVLEPGKPFVSNELSSKPFRFLLFSDLRELSLYAPREHPRI